MKVVAYTRGSTAHQIDTQIRQITKYCRSRGDEIVNIVYSDKVSDSDRPGFQQMLLDLGRGSPAQALVIARLDSVGRSFQDLLRIYHHLEGRGVAFICLAPPIDSTTPDGRAFFSAGEHFAEYERNLRAPSPHGGKIPVDLAEVRRMFDDGVPKTEICQRLGISRSTLYKRLWGDEEQEKRSEEK
jgi:DNA invertase Pin-like site-specific DNA recombinase